ncbi:MAG: hypothetical protein HRU18_01580 [Pseudoalteromonas sp.]|uniref:hypothetical protein n=1 Tax=Pseudoalteromonas sp. TaxID=53249 RepID=UPI001DDFB219|nr:hypothetical protein [Pseudoalteromonas sp.]NRA76872.1 hypothetical protein [Pseudoalteromonas sp.]
MAIVPSFIPGHETINGAINSFFGSDSLDVIRSIDYDVKYLWALKIVSGAPPKPFDSWFPAQDVSVPMAISESETIEFAQSSMQVPIKTTGKEITITFYDNDKRALLFWLSDWINIDLQNGGRFMSGIADNHPIVKARNPIVANVGNNVVPVRTIELTLLSKYKKIDKTIMYDVFPVGELPWSGDQSSEAQTYNMRFAIVKEYEATSDNRTSFLDIAKDILSRFI